MKRKRKRPVGPKSQSPFLFLNQGPNTKKLFGTHFRNGSLRLIIDGLSLNHTWCDPQTIPHWVCPRGSKEVMWEAPEGNRPQIQFESQHVGSTPIIEEVGDLEESSPTEDERQGKAHSHR